MELLIQYVLPLVLGAIGGGGVGSASNNLSLGTTGNIIAGALGGLGGGTIADLLGIAGTIAAGASGADAGGLDMGALVASGASGLVGGGALTAVAGLIKNAMAK